MTHRKSPKKTETVEIRLSHAAKIAFMARCRAEGMTASEAIRRFIDADRTDVRAAPWRQIWIAAVAGLALGAIAAPSLAQSLSPSRAAFDRLDRDRNGVVTFEEFRAR